MASLNKVMLMGNLGRDPELRYTQSNQAVANFSIATSETWKDKGGEKQERTEWHKITVWGKQAESCANYLRKGRPVLVEGKLQTREWEDKDGNKRFTTEIVAERVLFLGSRESSGIDGDDGGPSESDRYQRRGRKQDDEPPPIEDGDIPF